MDSRKFLDDCLKRMAEENASDLHIKANCVPRIRVSGVIVKTDLTVPDSALLEELTQSLMNEYYRDVFAKQRSVDLAYQSDTYGRFRVNIFKQSGCISIVVRIIKNVVPPFSELYIPEIFEKVSMKDRGLILIAGATSSGKSTTVASMINFMNNNRDAHIITLEDPIEYVYSDNRCLINQREIGQDANSFSDALKYVVRQDPDVIVIGEMRDAESFKSAMVASETGHLVVSTIHAKNVAQVFDRILGFFPASQREQVLVQLSFNMQSISCQRLLQRLDNQGLVPACEILLNSPTTSKLIRDNILDKIDHAMINASEEGMQTFNQSLCSLYNQKLISKDEALLGSDNPQALEMNLQGIYLDDASGGILDR